MAVIACTGGRDFADRDFVYATLDFASGYYNVHKVIVGDAKGADKLVWDWCEEAGMSYKIFYAEWEKYGNPAGPIRNREMLDTHPDYLIAFPGGTGTSGCVKEAKKRWIPIIDHRYRH